MRTLTLALLVLFSSLSMMAQSKPMNLMPLPAGLQPASGQFVIDSAFTVGTATSSDPRVHRSLELFLGQLRRQLAMPPQAFAFSDFAKAKLQVTVQRAGKPVQELGEDESYSLVIAPETIKLDAVTPLGAMRGLQTLLQLEQTTPFGFAVPARTIRDQPRFPWRGLMIDTSRHFMPVDVLKRNLDGMAAVKLNVFHWHLSDNQGFRIESKVFPKLQQMGSDGLYYTQDEVQDVIAYARVRGIRVVPEFDMPGHATAWFVGYPELASGPGPYEIERKWGIFDPAMDPTRENTYKFLDKFIGEMGKLFPDKYFHIGGDEVNGKEWDRNPQIQAFMRSHGMKNNLDLQAYFNQRVQKLVAKHGKIMIGWDEVLRPDLPKDVVVQSWHGQASLASAASQGFRGILSYGYYLDLMWPARQHYAIDPLAEGASGLNAEEKQRILGGEACMWSEYVSSENVDSRIWPRLAVIAERLWSPENVKDVDSMYQRMQATSLWLEWLGLTQNSSYQPMLRRVAGSDEIAPLQALADVLEPVKDYQREEVAKVEATSLQPLDRLIDSVRPESTEAREFSKLVDTYLAGTADPQAVERLRHLLTKWRDNDAKLKPYQSSFLLQEDVPLSQELSAAAASGLQALDFLDRKEQAPANWVANQNAMLQRAQEQKAQLLNMAVPPIQKLVQAAGKATR